MAKGEQKMLHNGKLLENFINENNLNKSAIARELGISLSGLNGYYQRYSMRTATWWQLCRVLKHNFLAEIADASGIEYEAKHDTKFHKQVADLQQELSELQQKLSDKQREVDELNIKLSVYESIVRK